MPLYTFVCSNAHDEEVLCKPAERDTLVRSCTECGEISRWQGAELPVHRMDGKYRMKAVMANGTKQEISNAKTSARRSDS